MYPSAATDHGDAAPPAGAAAPAATDAGGAAPPAAAPAFLDGVDARVAAGIYNTDSPVAAAGAAALFPSPVHVRHVREVFQ